VELSPLGYQFFTDIFESFDKVSILSPKLFPWIISKSFHRTKMEL